MEEKKLDFGSFSRRVKKSYGTPVDSRSYQRYASLNHPVKDEFTLDEINDIIQNGNPQQLRDLSLYYYRINGIYHNMIDLRANYYLYSTVVVPQFDINKKYSKDRILKNFFLANKFIDTMDVPNNFSHIMREILINGVYYGILREIDGGITFQDLPVDYCRVRFKDNNGQDVIEFNLNYFNRIQDEILRKAAIQNFPKIIALSWEKLAKGRITDTWVEITADMGGVAFSSPDRTPPFISSIPDIYKMNDAINREAVRDENELRKILIQKAPIDSKGQLVFQLEELADIHNSVANMLSNEETVDVLTTFCDASLESLQDSTAASQSSDRIVKYVQNAYNALGLSYLLFNSDGSSSLPYSIKKEEALLSTYIYQFNSWIEMQVNKRYAQSSFRFDFEILPITVFNKSEEQGKFFQGAQYGYSKIYAGVAMGVKQSDVLSLMLVENEFLDMTNKMVPLQSTYTSSNNDVVDRVSGNKGEQESEDSDENSENSEKKIINKSKRNHINNDNKGGRPTKTVEQQSPKTISNNESKR